MDEHRDPRQHDRHQHGHGHAHVGGHGHDGAHADFESPAMVERAELEGEVLTGLVDRATSLIADQLDQQGTTVRRVVDIGCGPGVGTSQLAQRFESAQLLAVDGSAAMVARAAARAAELGFGDRVEARQVELPGDLGSPGRADLVWASMVLHHIGDEVAALRAIRPLVEPGGLLAVVEMAGPVRVLPADTGDGSAEGAALLTVEERIDAAWDAWFADMRASLPGHTTSSDYPSMLAAAGFELVGDELLTLELAAPLDEGGLAYAHRSLAGARKQLADHADAADLDALDRLLDPNAPESVLRRDDLTIRTTRHLFLAR